MPAPVKAELFTTELLVMVLIVRPRVLSKPPPSIAVLPDRVLLVIIISPSTLPMPPPAMAELPDTVQLVIVIVPELAMPPPRPAELPDTVLLASVNMPELFKMPPPVVLGAFPLLIVRVPIVTFTPRMWKMREALLPLMVRRGAPGPRMTSLSVMSSSPVVSVMVPVTLKVITSAPGFAFASKMACLNDPGPLSFRLVTVKPDTRAANDLLRRGIGNPPFAAAAERHVLNGPTSNAKAMSKM